MKIDKVLLLCLLAGIFSCNQPVSAPEHESEPKYDCSVSLDQLLTVDTIVGIMQGIDPWGEESSIDSIVDMNLTIESKLAKLLSCAAIEQLDLEGKFLNLNYSQTNDGRIRNFNWYANNGGTWQEMRHIYQYYPTPHVVMTTPVESFAGATEFYALKGEQPMYLGFGRDKTCSTCGADYAILFSFEGDSLQMENVMSIESRIGDVLKFEIDTATQVLHYAFIIDDMNEDWTQEFKKYKLGDLNFEFDAESWQPEEDAQVVVDSLVYDGKRFIEVR